MNWNTLSLLAAIVGVYHIAVAIAIYFMPKTWAAALLIFIGLVFLFLAKYLGGEEAES